MTITAREPGFNKKSHDGLVNMAKETWAIRQIYIQMTEPSDHRHMDLALSWYILVNHLCPEVTQMRDTSNLLDDRR